MIHRKQKMTWNIHNQSVHDWESIDVTEATGKHNDSPVTANEA